MNLPTYALADSPPSTILNVCLGLPPPTRTPTTPSSRPHHPRPYAGSSADLKGKAPAKHIEDPGQGEEQWQDAEFRTTKTHGPTHPSQSNINNQAKTASLSASDDHLQLLEHTGWDESFATANSDGWTIYRTYPLEIIHKHVVPIGSLRIVLPLYRTNILYLVGGPPSPLYSPNKVILYDSSKSKPIFSIELTQPVVGLTARKDKLVVVLRNQVHVFRVTDRTISEEGHWETSDNPKGLACLGSDFGSSLLVFLGRQSGKVQLVNLPPFKPDQSYDTPTTEPFQPIRIQKSRQAPYPSTSIILAHTTSLASLAMTPDGKLIATASVTGTLIRIWDSKTSALLRELRRGTDGAAMWGLRFRPDGLAICASSDKGTIHVWSLKERQSKVPNQEGKSGRPLALLKPYLPKYFHSTWSDAFFRLPPPGPASIKSLPLSLFSSLPNTSSSRPGDSSTGTVNHSGGQTQAEVNKAPTIEDDVSSVSWVLATTRDANGTIIEPQIIAITRSGGWFRLRMPDQPSVQLPDHLSHPSDSDGQLPTGSKSATSSHGTPNRLGISNDPSVQLECVEYRRFGQIDDWSDSDDSS